MHLVEVGPLDMRPGGCVANTGGDPVALGVPVTVFGQLGDDGLGSTLLRLLAVRGLSTQQLRVVAGCSTSYSLVLQPTGSDRAFWHHVGANAGFDGSAVDLTAGALLRFGYPPLLPALAATGGAALEALLVRARSAGLTTSLDLAVLDPNSLAARCWGITATRPP